MLSKRCLFVLLLVVSVNCQGSLDDLISELFVKNPGAGGTPIVSTETPVAPAANKCPLGSECVQNYLCNNGTINDSGEGLIDIRFDDADPCGHYLLQCCRDGDQKIVETTTRHPILPESRSCGHRNPDGVGFRITGANGEAEYGEFPWMVSLLKTDELFGRKIFVYQCGASIIHPQVIMTSAHCVQNKNPDELMARAGEWDTQTENEQFPYVDRKVVQILVRPDYYKAGLFNDVALLFLDKPYEFSETVQPVCLPPQDAKFAGKRCFASGWGKDVYGKEGSYQVILKKIDLPVVPRDKCEKALRTTRVGNKFKLHDSFICAGGEKGKDACRGDGGSPLVCEIDGKKNQYYQAGIVSWGIGCGENEIPGVYADVSHFRLWIDEQMKSKGFDISSYSV